MFERKEWNYLDFRLDELFNIVHLDADILVLSTSSFNRKCLHVKSGIYLDVFVSFWFFLN